MKRILSYTILLLISWATAIGADPKPDLAKLVSPPVIIKKKEKYFAVFNFGGLKLKHEVAKMPIPYPQCDAAELIGEEIKVVGNNPKGYIFFVKRSPIAFKPDHNPAWQDIIKKING